MIARMTTRNLPFTARIAFVAVNTIHECKKMSTMMSMMRRNPKNFMTMLLTVILKMTPKKNNTTRNPIPTDIDMKMRVGRTGHRHRL
jgi:hypothetical protein